jgi:flagella basal body P-ring formation protein FlgA
MSCWASSTTCADDAPRPGGGPRPHLLLAGLWLFLWTPPAGASGDAVSIMLKESVSLDSRHYTLADLAHIRGEAELVQRLAAVQIGRTPRPGYGAVVSRHRIAGRLERAVPGVYRLLRWSGGGTVRVQGVGMAQPAADYRPVAEAYLRDWLGARYQDFSVRPQGGGDDLLLPAGQVRFVPRLRGPGHPRSRMCVWLDAHVDGVFQESLPLWFDVSVYESVLVASRDLPARQSLQPGDYRMERRDISTAGGLTLGERSAMDGLRTRRALPAGSMLVAEALEPVPAVSRGQQVLVHAQAGRVTVKALAIALEDGEPKQRIRVRRPDGQASYSAVVIAAGQVSVEASYEP